MPARAPFSYATGTVIEMVDDRVHVLAKYGRYKESRLFAVSRAYWPAEHPPEEGQGCAIEFPPGEVFPRIRVTSSPPPTPCVWREDAIADARDLLGIAPGDSVTIVSEDMSAGEPDAGRRYGMQWRQPPALSRLPFLLQTCGIAAENVDCVFATSLSDRDLARYGETHVIFLGSSRTNAVFRERFRPWLKLSHSIPTDGEPRLRIESHGEVEELRFENLAPHVVETSGREGGEIHVVDPFFLAVTENPFDTEKYHRCIVCSGVGPFGTGYAVAVLTAREAVERLAEAFCHGDARRPVWEAAWKVEIRGRFGEYEDAVQCLSRRRNLEGYCANSLMSTPAVWSTAEDEHDQEDPISRALQNYRQA